MKIRYSQSAGAFSLVVSLIILTLLSILVASFLSSTALDRTTAHAFLGKSQSEIAADTAVKQAISMLRENITQYPDSVTYWETLNAPGASTATVPVEGATLYYYDQPLPTNLDPVPSPKRSRYVLPLNSMSIDAQTGQPKPPVLVADKAKLFDTVVWRESDTRGADGKPIKSTAVDLNSARSNGDTAGWIGSPPNPNGSARVSPEPFRARWVELKENGDINGRTIGRYAFWIEDESFKVNLNYLGNNKRGSEVTENARLKTDFTVSPTPTPLPVQLAALVPVQGLLRSSHSPAGIDLDTSASDTLKLRSGIVGGQLPDLPSFNQVAINNSKDSSNSSAYKLGEETKFLASSYSAALNLSRQGSQRFNLNGLGFDKPITDPAAKMKKLAQVFETIKYHAPRFGQRFYRTSTSTSPAIINAELVTPLNRNIYLYKIAANICDYIDPDFLPTIILDPGGTDVNRRGVLASQTKPTSGMYVANGNNPVWAQGKDSAPFLQEAVVRFRSDARGGKFSVKIDYYLEFWNMTNRAISAAELSGDANPVAFSTFVELIDAPGWVSVGGKLNGNWLYSNNSPPGDVDDGRRLTIDLINGVHSGQNSTSDPVSLVFQPGACTVITTDPDLLNSTDTSPNSSQITGGSYQTYTYYCGNLNGKREFTGDLPAGTTAINPVFRDGFEMSDYHTEVYLGNNHGYLDSQSFAVAATVKSQPTDYQTTTTSPPRDLAFGGSLLGNGTTPSELGDPRTNNEQLTITRYMSGGMTTASGRRTRSVEIRKPPEPRNQLSRSGFQTGPT